MADDEFHLVIFAVVADKNGKLLDIKRASQTDAVSLEGTEYYLVKAFLCSANIRIYSKNVKLSYFIFII